MSARRLALAAALGSCAIARPAAASSALESPDTGVVQLGRGGAWLVRADDPLAVYVNPAALVTQGHGVTVGTQLLFLRRCFDRVSADGSRPSPGQDLAAPPNETCADVSPYPNPQLAASFRLHQRVALGVGVLSPHGVGAASWPASRVYPDRTGLTEHPSPQRYLLLSSDDLVLWPTLSLGVAATRELSFGAGFVWGVAALDFATMTEAISPPRDASEPDDFTNDVRARVRGFDGFVPGLVGSVLWSPSKIVSLAAWARWSDAIRMRVRLTTQASPYTAGGRIDAASVADPANRTDVEDAGELRLAIPAEAKLGVRFRLPRSDVLSPRWGLGHGGWIQDPLSSELFDVEIDLTWAGNGAVDALDVRFDPGIQIRPTTGFVPEDASVAHGWRDALGVRVGADVAVLPDLLALRAGAFFESSAANAQQVQIDFQPSERVGLGAGATVRLGPVDLSVAYQHTFFGAIDNDGTGTLHAISGDRSTGERSRQVVNGGRATAALDELGFGATAHY